MATVVASELDRVADSLAPGVSLNSHTKASPPWVSPSTSRGAWLGIWNSSSVALALTGCTPSGPGIPTLYPTDQMSRSLPREVMDLTR